MKHRSTGYWAIFSVSIAAITTCIFWLPYHVPVFPSISDSYFFGFNNRVSWLLFLLFAGAMTLFGPDARNGSVPGKPLKGSTLRKALLGGFVCATGMYLWTRKLNGYDEAIYLIDRIRLLLEGKIPYREFEYAYGAGFLYCPAWIARFLHLGIADAYGLFYILVSLLGTFLLYVCLLWIDGAPAGKRRIFLFVWAVSLVFMLNFGVNYSLLRFDLPIFWMLLVHRAVMDRTTSGLVPFGLAVLGYGITLLVSPELAIAFGLGSVLYLAFAGRLRIPMNALGFALMMIALGAISVFARRLDVFRTMTAFRMGGFNFPVIPAPHILLFLLATGVVACQAGTLLRSRRTGAVLPLFAFSLFAAAAALGRCDPGHVLMNGLSVFLCAGIVMGAMRLPGTLYVPALWLVFLVVPILLGGASMANTLGKAALPTIFAMERGDELSGFDRWVFRRMKRQLGDELATEKLAEYRAAAHRKPKFSLDEVFDQAAGTVYEAPFGFSLTHFGLYHARNVDEGFFFEMINVVTPEQVERKVNELRVHPDRPLVLLAGREDSCGMSVAGERALISRLFLFPYRAQSVPLQSLDEPLCRYIHLHYRQSSAADAAHFGYALWSPAD